MAAKKKSVPDAIADAEQEIMFPDREVVLSNKSRTIVRAWSLEVGPIQTTRIIEIFNKATAQGKVRPDISPAELVPMFVDDFRAIVLDSIDWTEDEFAANCKRFEDFVHLARVAFEVNVIRQDGGGVLPHILALSGARGLGLVAVPNVPESPSSPTSS